jgi:uncharacterized spore protein YtfJ
MQNNNNVAEILQVLVSELKQMARTETIVGEPVTAGDKTLVPVCTITVGFGAGGGSGSGPDGTSSGFGGGGGAGLKIQPTAFIVLDKDGVSLLPAKRGSWENIIEAIPGVIEKVAKLKDKKAEGKASEESK